MRAALKEGKQQIIVEGEIKLTSQLVIDQSNITITGGSIDGTEVNDRADGSVGGGAVVVRGSNVNFTDITIKANDTDNKEESSKAGTRYALQYWKASGKLDGVTLEGGAYWNLLVNGSEVTVVGGSDVGKVDFARGEGTESPKLTVMGSTVETVNIDDPAALGLNDTGNKEALVEDLKKFIVSDVDVSVRINSKDDYVTVAPEDTSDDKPSRRDNDDSDYYGVEKWDEVKRQIADADEGDTIKVSGTGLPYFPSSVARELKGKDITLEIRKNGVTYKVNGLEIGEIDKIWYEFENIEEQLLTAEPEKDKADEQKPQDGNTVKENPATGR